MTWLDALPAGLEFLAAGWVPVIAAGVSLVLLITVVALLLRRRPDLSVELEEAQATAQAFETERDAVRSEMISLRVEVESAKEAAKLAAAKPAVPEGGTMRERQLQQELLLQSQKIKALTSELEAAKSAVPIQSSDPLKAQLESVIHDKQAVEAELKTEKERSLALRQERDALAARVAAAAQEAPVAVPAVPTDGDAASQLARFQHFLVAQGKMATLGQLIAGIIHEINTPLGAINAATSSFHKTIPLLLHEYPAILNDLPPDLKKLFFELLDKSMEPHEALSSKEERSAKRNLTDTMEAAGVPNAGNIAANLVKAGIVGGIEHYVELFKHPKTDQIFEMLSNATKIKMNMDNTEVAMNKMQRMVTGLKNFSHPASGNLESTNLKENITTVLTVYHNKLKYGVDVTTHFDPSLELINAYPDELTQVWTNLIHNAVDAMEGKGSLDVSLNRENGYVRVDITDSGPGIPAEIAKRIWEPFYTTKAKGQGTGLGLDIVRRIIEKHKGSISVDSAPGRTCFTVRIPENLAA